MLEHEHCRVPVTALALTDKFLLAGEGPDLKIYDHANNLLSTLRVFEQQFIHGITVCDHGESSLAVVWGGSLASAVRFEPSISDDKHQHTHIELLFTPLSTPDWILSAQFRPTKPSAKDSVHNIALVTAHNSLLLLQVDSLQPQETQLRQLTSQSKCILYSADISWTSPSRALVASGTVFGEIIIWSCHVTDDAVTTFLHKVFTGHDGSVFGVRISEEWEVPANILPIRLLASCSDDRTIRLWDLSNLEDTQADPQSITDLPSARETGFGSGLEESLPGAAQTEGSLCKAWGHASRIWSVDFVLSAKPVRGWPLIANLVTFGEDATCQYWALRQTTGPAMYMLENTGMISMHDGKNIWSSALISRAGSAVRIATGGADGSIAIVEKPLPFSRPEDACTVWSVSDGVNQAMPDHSKNEKLRSYAFIGPNELIVAVNSGDVLIVLAGVSEADICEKYKTIERSPQSWTWFAHNEDLQGYSVAISLPSWPLALFSSRSGSIFAYTPGMVDLQPISAGRGKTASLFLQEMKYQGLGPASAVSLATTVEQTVAQLLFITKAADDNHEHLITKTSMLQLPTSFVVTSFAVAWQTVDSRLYILGSRNGSIAIFSSSEKSSLDGQKHVLLVEGAHGNDAVTDLKVLDQGKPVNAPTYLFSSGRDGTFVAHELRVEEGRVSLTLVHRLAVPDATTVEQIILEAESSRLAVCAFRSKHFILYDMIDESEVFSINCGGANRTWTFNAGGGGTMGTLAWTKASQLCMQRGMNEVLKRINHGGHGREIKSIAISNHSTDLGRLIATGAEDTDIKIHKYEADIHGKPAFRCLRTIKQHNTGIQHLEWSHDGRYLFSSGGFEELFAWRVQSIPLLQIGVVCDSICPPESELPDLRITHFAVQQHQQQHQTAGLDVENDKFTVATVRSDSTIRVYSFSTSTVQRVWSCVFAGTYLSCSLTQILRWPSVEPDYFMTIATDGHVGIFSTQAKAIEIGVTPEVGALNWLSRFKTHQSTVHCAEIRTIGSSDHLIFSGGDDNALSVSRVAIKPSGSLPIQTSTLTAARAHTAAVTGLAVIDVPYQTHVYWVLTTSIDQRLKLWEVCVTADKAGVDGIKIRKLTNVYTPVADASGLSLFVHENTVLAMVCGVGLDIWKIDLSKSHRE